MFYLQCKYCGKEVESVLKRNNACCFECRREINRDRSLLRMRKLKKQSLDISEVKKLRKKAKGIWTDKDIRDFIKQSWGV